MWLVPGGEQSPPNKPEVINWTFCPECGEDSYKYQLAPSICEHCGCEVAEWVIKPTPWKE